MKMNNKSNESNFNYIRSKIKNIGIKTRKATSFTKKIILITLLLLIVASIFFTYHQGKGNKNTIRPIIFSYSSPESQGISNRSIEKLFETVQGFVEKEQIIGGELVVIKNRNIILHETVGWKSIKNKTPMQKNTIFNIRSMTKPITGTAIQILIEENRINLDTKISEYITGFDNEASRNITIKQLLTHYSGLPLTIMTNIDDYDSLQSLANATGIIGPQFTPGEKFWYSDAGTEVLGAIIEIETGQKLDEFVTERIMVPLGMNNSFYYYNATVEDPRILLSILHRFLELLREPSGTESLNFLHYLKKQITLIIVLDLRIGGRGGI